MGWTLLPPERRNCTGCLSNCGLWHWSVLLYQLVLMGGIEPPGKSAPAESRHMSFGKSIPPSGLHINNSSECLALLQPFRILLPFLWFCFYSSLFRYARSASSLRLRLCPSRHRKAAIARYCCSCLLPPLHPQLRCEQRRRLVLLVHALLPLSKSLYINIADLCPLVSYWF